jgi:acyl-CoA thioester hydrolase
MCDAVGHLNVRHYVALFDDASFQLLGRIAGTNDTTTGWADVRMEIDYSREVPMGKLVSVFSRVDAIGNSSVTYVHEMRGSLDQELHAKMRVVSVRFDLVKRAKRQLTDAERKTAQSYMAA